MSFLKDSQTWQDGPSWTSEQISLPNLYEPLKNLNITKLPIITEEPVVVDLPPLPEEIIEEPIEEPPQTQPIAPTEPVTPPNATQLEPTNPLPEIQKSPIHVKLVAKPADFKVKINAPVAAPMSIGEINANQELLNKISEKIDQLVQDADELPNFENFYKAAKKSSAPDQEPTQETKIATPTEIMPRPQNLDDFYKFNQKDLLLEIMEGVIDFMVCMPDLTPSQTHIMKLISDVVKLVVYNFDTTLNMNLEPGDSFMLVKNLSIIVFLLYSEKIEALMTPTLNGSLTAMKENKAKVVALLTTPILFKIIFKKLAARSKTPAPPIPPPQTAHQKVSSSQKRKLTTPFPDEDPEDTVPQIPPPMFRVTRVPTAKILRLESRK